MELNNFENQLREEINNREIQPLNATWDKLDALLSVSEKPKTKRSWRYFAASSIGLLTVGALFFNQEIKNIKTQNKTVVFQKKRAFGNRILDLEKIPVQTKLVVNQRTVAYEPIKKPVQFLKVKKAVATISKTNPKNAFEVLESNNLVLPKKTNVRDSNSETVEKLLEAAIAFSKPKNSAIQNERIHVNPTNLLSDVEGKSELIFREKFSDKLLNKCQAVKVALANRNFK